MRKALSLLIAAFALNGCVSNQPKAVKIDTNDSFATRIVKYAHFDTRIKEMPPGVFSEFKTSSQGTPVINTALIAGYSFSDWQPPIGSTGVASTVLLYDLLIPKQKKITSKNSTQFLGWMPKELATSDKKARTFFHELIFNESKKILELDFPDATLNKTNDGGDLFVLSTDFDRTGKINPFPAPVETPSEIGNYNAWAFSQKQMIYSLYMRKNDNVKKQEQLSYDFYIKLSKALPDWVYIYLAPYKVEHNDKVVRPFPVILNKGEMHFFIKSNKIALN